MLGALEKMFFTHHFLQQYATFGWINQMSTCDETRSTGPFNRISISNGIVVRLSKSHDTHVCLSGPKNERRRIQTEVNGDCLLLSVPDEAGALQDTIVLVTAPLLNSIECTGGVSVDGSSHDSEILSLQCAGGSSCRLAGIRSSQLEVDINGGSRVALSGIASIAHYDVRGASSLSAQLLEVASVNIQESGASSASIVALEEIRGTVSGASRLAVAGSPNVRDIERSGASLVRYVGRSEQAFESFFSPLGFSDIPNQERNAIMADQRVDLSHLSGKEVDTVARTLATGNLQFILDNSDALKEVRTDDFQRIVDLAAATRANCGGIGCG